MLANHHCWRYLRFPPGLYHKRPWLMDIVRLLILHSMLLSCLLFFQRSLLQPAEQQYLLLPPGQMLQIRTHRVSRYRHNHRLYHLLCQFVWCDRKQYPVTLLRLLHLPWFQPVGQHSPWTRFQRVRHRPKQRPIMLQKYLLSVFSSFSFLSFFFYLLFFNPLFRLFRRLCYRNPRQITTGRYCQYAQI